MGVCACSAISGAVRVVLSFQNWGSAGRGALSCPFPWTETSCGAHGCGQQGSVHPGCTRAVLEGPGALQAGTGAPIPQLPSPLPGCCLWALSLRCSQANNTREEAECCCPEPSRAHSPPAHPPPPHPPPPSPPSGALCARGCCHLSVLAHPGCPSAMPCIFASGRCQNLHHFHLCAQWHQFSSLRLFLLMTTGVCTRSSHVGGKNSL